MMTISVFPKSLKFNISTIPLAVISPDTMGISLQYLHRSLAVVSQDGNIYSISPPFPYSVFDPPPAPPGVFWSKMYQYAWKDVWQQCSCVVKWATNRKPWWLINSAICEKSSSMTPYESMNILLSKYDCLKQLSVISNEYADFFAIAILKVSI